MKRNATFFIVLIGFAASTGWIIPYEAAARDADDKPAVKSPAALEAKTAELTHDANGNAVITMPVETQEKIGLETTNLAAAQFAPEVRGYGRVLDAASLAVLTSEVASARAAYEVSSNELARLKVLTEQGNASKRNLQSAEAVAQRDQFVVQAAQDKLALSWGRTIADSTNLNSLPKKLTSGTAALVRIDLAAGDNAPTQPTEARIVTLSGQTSTGDFLEIAPDMDAQTQGRGFMFLVATNALQLVPGQAVTGYLKITGDPATGVIVPSAAVVRTEGLGWIYVAGDDGKTFTRTKINLDRPADGGWFVTQNVKVGGQIVVVGAQTLLSEELKASIQPD